MTKDIDVNFEPLPGYRLIERLGAGGYGEVWRAEAPGGLTKAIKFVFGKHHEKRASNELRALDHVRGVRHPFLLSLERIEVVDGRLLVVTELADGSLKDRFDLCRREGMRGIPRDELLRYLRDAADALDFMSETHALQHLDIKPENLLLLADHVKVADFGLVKDVRQSQASLVGGMTPLYAAPEVFRGTPSRHSDQYSLGIVYQEMVTGTLPFGGSNVAELTLQHLNDEPDLTSLSTVDRYTVSRALSKDPQHRYATCRDFVDALLKAAPIAAAPESGSPISQFACATEVSDASTRETIQTDFMNEEQSAAWNARAPQLLVELPTSDCRMVDLPPVDLVGRDARPTPTLVLGIGGTAGRVLSRLRRLIGEQWGGANQIPAVQFLLVDTDARGLTDASQGETNGLTADEVLNLPLRRPQHYRENSQQLLHWLSRRWLYNIPRSLRTEGLRPLGRLALADNSRQTGQRLRRAMVQALDATSITKSNSVVGQEFRSDALRVFVVASISGGTGGGMALDMGYAVRAILQKLGLAHDRIIGLMMHSTGRDARHCELARVNAFSWLTEYHHFQQFENSYPGDVSCGLPAHAAGVPAFDYTYLLHLGENLDNVEFDNATQAVADYLKLNVLSAAGPFIDACRDNCQKGAETEQAAMTAGLRSFGVYRRTAAPSEFCDEFAAVLSHHIVSTWKGAERPAEATSPLGIGQSSVGVGDVNTADSDEVQFVHRLQLEDVGLVGNVRSLVEVELGMDPAAFLAAWLANQANTKQVGMKDVLDSIDHVFGAQQRTKDSIQEIAMLGRTPAAIVMPLAEMLRGEVRRWVTRRIDEPKERLAGARRVLSWINRHLQQIDAELHRRRSTLADKLFQLRTEAAVTNTETSIASDAVARSADPIRTHEYFNLRLDQMAILAAQHAVRGIAADAKAISDEITSLGREIDQITAAVARSASAQAAGGDSERQEAGSTSRGRLAISLRTILPEIAVQVDARLQAEYINSNGGLAKTVMQGGRPRAMLTAKLHELSRKAVYQALADMKDANCDSRENGSAENDLQTALALATPTLLEYGGRRRVLAILPGGVAANETFAATVSQTLGTAVTAIPGADSNLTLCVEADGLSLQHIALDLIEQRRDRVEFAGRVHCRTDIAWTTLAPTSAPQALENWCADDARQIQSQQAMCKTLVM